MFTTPSFSDNVRHILEIAVLAPSGDNAQPWRFVVRGGALFLYNMSERDASLYNFRQRGSFLAHGAVLENIVVIAPSFGLVAEATPFPIPGDSDCTARVEFAPTAIREDPLLPFVERRATNRKPYEPRPLLAEHREALLAASQGVSGLTTHLVEERQRVGLLAAAISVSDRLILENRTIHDGIFKSIRWTRAEERTTPGLYIRTLELVPPQRAMFRLFRHWPIVSALNRLGAARFLASQTAKLYATASAIGVIAIDGDGDVGFLRAGQALQRVWLTATKLGLSLQPITAVAYLGQRVAVGEAEALAPYQIELVRRAEARIREVAGIERGTIAMIFRVGYSGGPSARSSKLPPDISETNDPGRTPLGSRSRKAIIARIVDDLESLRGDSAFANQYAVEENAAFFRAIANPVTYCRWLVGRAPKIEGERLLELADMPLPYWEREMHRQLVAVEKKKFPGLITPLVTRIVEWIARENRPLVIANLGCGGMEVERQVIRQLQANAHSEQVVFVGLDQSPVARELARENLRDVAPWLEFHEVHTLGEGLLAQLKRSAQHQYVVIMCQNEVLSLSNQFAPRALDLIFNSLFKHHLGERQKEDLDAVIMRTAPHMLEYDGYRSWLVMIPQTFTVWHSPVLLNATIFSDLRYLSKQMVQARYRGDSLSFFKIGTYLRERNVAFPK